MSKPNSKAQKTQIIEVLKQDYFPIIPQINRNWTAKQHEENRLSRSLAAFAITNLANITPPVRLLTQLSMAKMIMVLMRFILIELITDFG
ncbi:MAG: hypothetical protein ACKO3K_17095 [Cuspidothrix sp.]